MTISWQFYQSLNISTCQAIDRERAIKRMRQGPQTSGALSLRVADSGPRCMSVGCA